MAATTSAFGLADEVSELVAPTPTLFEWSPQPGATAYEVVLSSDVFFQEGCTTSNTDDAFIDDAAAPPPSGLTFYLVRPAAPFQGSWGQTSRGQRRGVTCHL